MTNKRRAPRGRDDEAIARRAYELYEKRGREHGHDEEDWLEAERELYPEGAPPLNEQTPTSQ